MKPFIPLFLGFRNFKGGKSKKNISRHMQGSILGIGLSIIPLIVVIVVSNGMIEGITSRFLELNTYHIQAELYHNPEEPKKNIVIKSLEDIKGVKNAFFERSGFALVRAGGSLSGITIRSIPEQIYNIDEGFRKYLKIYDGEFNLSSIPSYINGNFFKGRIKKSLSDNDFNLFSSCYKENREENIFIRKELIDTDADKAIKEIMKQMRISTILLGKSLADKLNVGKGDIVFILSYNDFRSKIILKSSRFIVTGVFSTGYQDIDKYLAYIPYSQHHTILAQEKAKDYIGIKVFDPFSKNLKMIVHDIKKDLAENEILFSNVESWYELQINQYKSFKTTKAILVFIMILIIIVASVNVSSQMVIIVMEKTQEIAILKSMGCSPGNISLSFLIIGFFTGAVGTLIGVFTGLAVGVNINEIIKGVESLLNLVINLAKYILSPFIQYEKSSPLLLFNPEFYLDRIPVRISILEIFLVGFLTILLTTLASYLPARNAGRIRPLDIIRKY